MTDKRLQAFRAVALNKSFTKAALEMKMTQPAITFHIKQLEKQYCVKLFNRLSNKVSLTNAGELMLRKSEEIFRIYDEIQRALQSEVKQMTIAATMDMDNNILSEVVANFNKAHPDVKVKLLITRPEQIANTLANQEAELVFCDAPLGDNYNALQLASEDLVVLVPDGHKLAGRTNVDLQELVQEPLVLQTSNLVNPVALKDLLNQHNSASPDLNIVLELNNITAIQSSVLNHVGVGIVNAQNLAELEAGVVAVKVNQKLNSGLYAVYNQNVSYDSLVAKFIAACETMCAKRVAATNNQDIQTA